MDRSRAQKIRQRESATCTCEAQKHTCAARHFAPNRLWFLRFFSAPNRAQMHTTSSRRILRRQPFDGRRAVAYRHCWWMHRCQDVNWIISNLIYVTPCARACENACGIPPLHFSFTRSLQFCCCDRICSCRETHTHTMQTVYRFRSTSSNRCGLSEQYKTLDGGWWVNSPSASKSNRASQLNAGSMSENDKQPIEYTAHHLRSLQLRNGDSKAHNIATREHEAFHNRHISTEMKPNNWWFLERFAVIDWFRYRFDDLIYYYLAGLRWIEAHCKIELYVCVYSQIDCAINSTVRLFGTRDTHALGLLTTNRPSHVRTSINTTQCDIKN